MADDTLASNQGEVNLKAGSNEIPPLSLGETGFNGLVVLGNDILEECQHELRWPLAGTTYKKMAKDGAIAPALELVEMLINRVPWEVKVPKGYEDSLSEKAQFVRQNMNDMEMPWEDVIKNISTFNRYGFSIVEKVYRYRRKDEGSKYDDGLIGLKKLVGRSQDSVDRFRFKNQGRDIDGFYQRVVVPPIETSEGIRVLTSSTTTSTTTKFIPRKKYLHFRNNPLKDNPYGESPLKGCWGSWKYKTAFQEAEAIGVAQDANGFKVLYLPPQYLKADSTDEDKLVLKEYQKVMANVQVARQSGIILPLIQDENGNKLFEFDLKSITGSKQYDVDVIIKRYTAEILTSLFADFLSLGTQGGGSFSLAESKISIIEMAIEARLNEIKSQLNHDLMRQLFELNGWDTDVMPYFDYGSIGKETLEELGKFVQRVAAVGMLPKTGPVVNWILDKAEIPYNVSDDISTQKLAEELTPDTSRSGDGMSSGMNNGVGGSTGSSGNSSTSNTENA